MTAIPETVASTLVSINPATLEPVGSVPLTPLDAIDDIVLEARAAQRAWASLSAGERCRVLRRAGHELLAAADEVAGTIVGETGKPIVEAYTSELFVSLDHLGWLARRAPRALRDERVPLRRPHLLHKSARLRRDPVGVVAVVAPWNFPLGVPLTQVAAAVAAGNAAVVKPSELTPVTGAWLEELFVRAGAPVGLVRVVQGGAAAGDALVGHPEVDAIVFTGSTGVGRRVALRAAERLVPVTLELGGKDPMIVLADADLDRAVYGAVWGAFTNCGQVCSGVERVYVEAAVYDAFVTRLGEEAAALRIGRGSNLSTDLGPLVTERARARVEALVADALEHGAELVAGGGRPDVGLPGWFHQPTVLAGEPAAARLSREEIFGPVVTVARIENEADGIRRANDCEFALGASIWTRSRDRGRRVAAALTAGSVWVNDHAYSYGVAEAPWGGRKASGIGRTHARQGLDAMTHVTFVDGDSGRLHAPWWYPYSEMMLDGFRGALGALYGDGLAARAAAARRHRRGLVRLARKASGR